MNRAVTIEIVEGMLNGQADAVRLSPGLKWQQSAIVIERFATFAFGRAQECQVRFPETDDEISRRHFELVVSANGVQIRDCDSLNGTLVNGLQIGNIRRIHPNGFPASAVPLQDGNLVKAGRTVFRVRIADHPMALENPRIGEWESRSSGEEQNNASGGVAAPEAANPWGQEQVRFMGESGASPQSGQAVAVGGLWLRNRHGPPQIHGFGIQRHLGRSGPALSYVCRPVTGGGRVVIKVLRGNCRLEASRVQALRNACDRLCAVRHEGLVSLLDYGLADFGSEGYGLCLEVEHCSGGNAQQRANENGGRLPAHEVYYLMKDCLSGLAHAHSREIVHGQIKPTNLLLAESDGRKSVKIGDFGLRNLLGLFFPAEQGGEENKNDFAAPEQSDPAVGLSPAADVWSLGAVAYYLLTGQIPWETSGRGLQVGASRPARIVPIRQRYKTVPRGTDGLLDLIDGALVSSVHERCPNAVELWRQFQRLSPPAAVELK